MDILISFLEIYGSIAATVKYGFTQIPFINNSKFNSSITVISWIISSFLLVILTVLLFFLAIYKALIVCILKKRHGDNFAGVLESADALWLVEDETVNNIVNLVLVMEFKKPEDNLVEYAKNLCENRFFKSKRLTSIRKFFMGYGYFLGNQVSADDIVSSVKISADGVCNERDLRRFVAEYANTALPKENRGAFQIIVCEDRVNLDGDHNEQYAFLFRIHHSVGDGVTLTSMFINILSDEGKGVIQNNIRKNKSDLKQYLRKFYNCESYINTLFTPRDENRLRTSKLSTEKYAAFKTETGKSVMVEKVKKIKKFYKCTFSIVIYTAMSESLYNFFNKVREIPQSITLTFMVIPPRDLHFNHKELKNVISVGNIKIPIRGATLEETLRLITTEFGKYTNSCDSWICYWQLRTFCNLLPSPLVKLLVRFSAITTVGFTNMPGAKKIHIEGRAVNHKFFWVPNFVTTGVGFTVSTYDDKLQMGLLADKCLIPDEEEVQRILDDVYANIDKMHDTVCKNE